MNGPIVTAMCVCRVCCVCVCVCVCVVCVCWGKSCILLTYRDGSNIWMLYLSASSQRHNSRQAWNRWIVRRRLKILSWDSCVEWLVYRALPLSYTSCHCTHKLLGSIHTHTLMVIIYYTVTGYLHVYPTPSTLLALFPSPVLTSGGLPFLQLTG